MSEIREAVTLRLKRDDKALLECKAAEAGLEGGTAARQIVELVLRRMATGTDYIDALQLVKTALKVHDLRART